MKIGISTASLYPTLLEDSLRTVGENGVKTTEIFLNTFCEMEPEFIKELCRIRDDYGINIASLHPFTSGFEPYLLFQTYQRRYKDGFQMYKKYFHIAATLGAKVFVLHGDKIGGVITPYEYCERFAKLSEAASFEGVTLTQENVNGYRASAPDFIRQMVDLLGNRALFTYDVKQTIRAGYTPWEIYDAMRGHIAHMHLSDNNLQHDCLLPGNGNFSFEKLFRIAMADGYEGNALIEVYSNSYRLPEQIFDSLKLLQQKYQSVI